jgi:pimeloyl-ACP methyl ester carboxylesterase
VGLDGISEDAVREYLQRVISQPDVLDLALNWYRANVPGGRLTAAVGAIEVPTLYLWGTADPTFCRETAEDSAQYVESRYRFVAIEGGGHWLPETETSTVNRELLAHLAQ